MQTTLIIIGIIIIVILTALYLFARVKNEKYSGCCRQ